MCFEMGARTPSAGCKRAADESEAQFIFGYLLESSRGGSVTNAVRSGDGFGAGANRIPN
jgi:hypothetical protein